MGMLCFQSKQEVCSNTSANNHLYLQNSLAKLCLSSIREEVSSFRANLERGKLLLLINLLKGLDLQVCCLHCIVHRSHKGTDVLSV